MSRLNSQNLVLVDVVGFKHYGLSERMTGVALARPSPAVDSKPFAEKPIATENLESTKTSAVTKRIAMAKSIAMAKLNAYLMDFVQNNFLADFRLEHKDPIPEVKTVDDFKKLLSDDEHKAYDGYAWRDIFWLYVLNYERKNNDQASMKTLDIFWDQLNPEERWDCGSPWRDTYMSERIKGFAPH
ncbi:MAG: hypothetical protein JWQ35_320 [Bacteriovoracaceae bacterium]|nr:hypothetical protein [Bacteriovoracaceae bacterium]